MDLIRRKYTLLYLAGLVFSLFVVVYLMVGIGSTAGDEVTGVRNLVVDEEVTLAAVFYIPIVRKDPTLTPTPRPIITPVPNAPNLLPNPSFEDGWSHPGNIPEIQVPLQWSLSWDEGENPLDPAPWNEFVRPESRLLSADFLPPEEEDLFIWDGQWTLKIFKGSGALSYRLKSNVRLSPGTYLLNIHIFPDLVVDYTSSGEKIWAPDPLSGEVRFDIDGVKSNWILPRFGEKNTLQSVFHVSHEKQVNLIVAIRGRWAIRNNGWFMDDWSLTKMK
jgi:hypothetical protein